MQRSQRFCTVLLLTTLISREKQGLKKRENETVLHCFEFIFWREIFTNDTFVVLSKYCVHPECF